MAIKVNNYYVYVQIKDYSQITYKLSQVLIKLLNEKYKIIKINK